MSSDVTTRLLNLIADVLEIDPSAVRVQAHFFNDLGASSLDIAEMVWRIEDDESFGVGEIPDEILENVRCVQDVVDYIQGRGQLTGPTSGVMPVHARLGIASDLAGYPLKQMLNRFLSDDLKVAYRDLGPADSSPVDYPDSAEAVARAVARGEIEQGILVGGSGIGMSIAANKIPGVRAAVAGNVVSAMFARKHHDANVLCLGGRIIGDDIARQCVSTFLSTPFSPGEDGRHQRRVERIADLERSQS